MTNVADIEKSRAERALWSVLKRVMDPEIPVVSVVDLGIVRGVHIDGDNVVVDVSPTYTGCPATQLIEAEILEALRREGYPKATVKRVLAPAWTTEWITDEGRARLTEYGIAPPATVKRRVSSLLGEEPEVACPRCGSTKTRKVSDFGSTPCKAHYACTSCLEPFDYFKCH